MELIDDRLKELTDWLEEVKGIKLDEGDINYFKRLLRRATNDGERTASQEAAKIIKDMSR
jgi:hypothetical protein